MISSIETGTSFAVIKDCRLITGNQIEGEESGIYDSRDIVIILAVLNNKNFETWLSSSKTACDNASCCSSYGGALVLFHPQKGAEVHTARDDHIDLLQIFWEFIVERHDEM